jgi:hypothetical protein
LTDQTTLGRLMAAPGGVPADYLPDPEDDLLTPAQAAEFLGVPFDQMARLRRQRRGPAFLRYGRFLVLYRRSALEAWAAGRQSH